MGSSASKQPPQEVPEEEVTALTTEISDPQLEAEQPLSQDAMQQDDDVVAEEEAAGTTGTVVIESTTTTVSRDEGDSFKVPSLPSKPVSALPLSPNSTSLRALPADIEHILSLGANRDELAKPKDAKTGGGEIDQVVKELREKYQQEGTEHAGEGELNEVEREMKEKGISRNRESAEDGDDKMDQDSDADESGPSGSDSDDSSSLESDSTSRAKQNATSQKQRVPRSRRRRGAADSGDEDDGDSDTGMGGSKSGPKTEHELVEPDPVLPQDIKIDPAAEIARFGKIESVIETVVVVKADTSGDWRVLDEGTVVCWQDKTVIGTIFETFGAVQQPFYSLRFPSNAIPDPAVFTLQKPVFYAPSHAQFVFTRDLRSLKGSDASNFFDEEAGAGEIEFSDDEQEAEYRKKLKHERAARRQSAAVEPLGSNPRQRSRGPSTTPRSPPVGHASLPARPKISYADAEEPIASSSTSRSIPKVPGTSFVYDMYGPPVELPTTASKKGPKVEMGDKPPPGRVGRKMFERDTGRELEEGEQVEFEFSDGEGGDSGSDSGDDRMKDTKKFKGESTQGYQQTGGRGRGGRGRGGADTAGGRGRGRGRGGAQDRGGRGNSRGGRGGERGGRGGRGGERNVAPLPARASPQTSRGGGAFPSGLPPRPAFDLPEAPPSGGSEERMSIDASQVPAFAPPIRFGEPTTFGGASGGSPSTSSAPKANYNPVAKTRSPPVQSRPTPRQPSSSVQGYNPQMPSAYPAQPPPSSYSNAYYRAPPPMHAPQQAYYPMPSTGPAAGASSSSGGAGGAYSPHQPQAAYPATGGQGAGGAAGHVNPRFLAQQQQQQQTNQPGQYPSPGAYGGPGGYGSYGGYGYGGGGYGGYGQGQGGQGR